MKDIILMIYPYAPFVGEEMYLSLAGASKIRSCSSAIPNSTKAFLSKKAADEEKILEMMIKDIRNYKALPIDGPERQSEACGLARKSRSKAVANIFRASPLPRLMK
jgi:valyl-tRNA synthetase